LGGCDVAHYHQLTRDLDNRWIAGVCSGLGNHTNIPTGLIRLAFVILMFPSFGFMIVGYILCAIFIPPGEPGQNDAEEQPA
jgi:phage shock protein C